MFTAINIRSASKTRRSIEHRGINAYAPVRPLQRLLSRPWGTVCVLYLRIIEWPVGALVDLMWPTYIHGCTNTGAARRDIRQGMLHYAYWHCRRQSFTLLPLPRPTGPHTTLNPHVTQGAHCRRTSEDACDSTVSLGYVREGDLSLADAHGGQDDGEEDFKHLLKGHVTILNECATIPEAQCIHGKYQRLHAAATSWCRRALLNTSSRPAASGGAVVAIQIKRIHRVNSMCTEEESLTGEMTQWESIPQHRPIKTGLMYIFGPGYPTQLTANSGISVTNHPLDLSINLCLHDMRIAPEILQQQLLRRWRY